MNFHGNLYHCYCRKCGKTISWQTYLQTDQHGTCEGQIRPAIVLYGERFADEVMERAIVAVHQAELIVIVGTSFQEHPFCDWIEFCEANVRILVITQELIALAQEYDFLQADGTIVFEKLSKGANYDN